MSRRPGFIVAATADVEPMPSPNAYLPRVTAELRVFWPPNATRDQIDESIARAIGSAIGELGRRRADYAESAADGPSS